MENHHFARTRALPNAELSTTETGVPRLHSTSCETALEVELRRLHIVQKNSRSNHPTTCGKAERFQLTLKKWLRAQPDQAATVAEL
jgi:GrpB-like predicted nucleotidyltransferase (UPF0157 family)